MAILAVTLFLFETGTANPNMIDTQHQSDGLPYLVACLDWHLEYIRFLTNEMNESFAGLSSYYTNCLVDLLYIVGESEQYENSPSICYETHSPFYDRTREELEIVSSLLYYRYKN